MSTYIPRFTAEAQRQMDNSVPVWEHPNVLYGYDPHSKPLSVGDAIVYPERDGCPEVHLVVISVSEDNTVLLGVSTKAGMS